MKGKYQGARLTSVPRVLTIAVEREPKGDDDIRAPGSFAVGGGLYRLVTCALWQGDLHNYTSIVFDADEWVSHDDADIDGSIPMEEDGGFSGPVRLAFFVRDAF
jgi:hypothetical protein